MPALFPATHSAQTSSPTCEIWIRTVGSRRQAFARPIHPADQRTRNWHGMQVGHAEKALRTGMLTTGQFAGSAVVARPATPEDQHPAAAAFREIAQELNRDIDTLNSAARGAR